MTLELPKPFFFEQHRKQKRFLGNLMDGKKQGTWKEFHPNERILIENYNDGKLDGSVSLFFKNLIYLD